MNCWFHHHSARPYGAGRIRVNTAPWPADAPEGSGFRRGSVSGGGEGPNRALLREMGRFRGSCELVNGGYKLAIGVYRSANGIYQPANDFCKAANGICKPANDVYRAVGGA